MSDSWMYTFFLKRAPARHKGSPTKPHFENTISILYLKIKYIHQKIQLKFFRGSKKFLTSKYLLIFPDGICSNLILFFKATSFSKPSSSQNHTKLRELSFLDSYKQQVEEICDLKFIIKSKQYFSSVKYYNLK